MVDLRALKTFHTIVKRGGFQKAAEALQYAQSTVTIQIQKLESDLGVKLFSRYGKRVQLTEEGRLLSHEAESLLNSVDDIKKLLETASTGYAGRVRIAANEPTASMRMPSIIADYCVKRPNVQLSMEVGGTDMIAAKVAEGKVDFGICSPVPSQTELVYEPLLQERFVLLMSGTNPLADQPYVSLHDLSTQRILMKEQTCHYRAMIEWSLMGKVDHLFTGIEVGSFEAMKGMVQANLGIAFVPAVTVAELPPGTTTRDLVGADLRLSIGLLYRTNTNMGKAASALLQACRTGLSADL